MPKYEFFVRVSYYRNSILSRIQTSINSDSQVITISRQGMILKVSVHEFVKVPKEVIAYISLGDSDCIVLNLVDCPELIVHHMGEWKKDSEHGISKTCRVIEIMFESVELRDRALRIVKELIPDVSVIKTDSEDMSHEPAMDNLVHLSDDHPKFSDLFHQYSSMFKPIPKCTQTVISVEAVEDEKSFEPVGPLEADDEEEPVDPLVAQARQHIQNLRRLNSRNQENFQRLQNSLESTKHLIT